MYSNNQGISIPSLGAKLLRRLRGISEARGSSVSPAVSTQGTVRIFSHYVNYATIFSFVSSKLITHNYNYRSNRRKTRIQPCKKIYKKSGYFLFYLSVTLFWAFLINLVTLKKECTHYITWIFISKHIFWFPATKLINLAPIFPLLSFSIGQSHLFFF